MGVVDLTPREDYQQKLDGLREDVVAMSETVLERLEMGLDALETGDEELAWEVIEGDAEVNEIYLAIEQDCIDLIALQQPVAGDLRLIAASFKIITDLERIGDLATNLGDYTLDARDAEFAELEVRKIGDFAAEMVEDSIRAYAEEDVRSCYEIDRRDDSLDEMCEQVSGDLIRGLISAGDVEEEDDVQRMLEESTRLLLTIRDLERVGDHAVNIAARTLYMIEGDDELIW